jgi:hypothetical protein
MLVHPSLQWRSIIFSIRGSRLSLLFTHDSFYNITNLMPVALTHLCLSMFTLAFILSRKLGCEFKNMNPITL